MSVVALQAFTPITSYISVVQSKAYGDAALGVAVFQIVKTVHVVVTTSAVQQFCERSPCVP